MKHLPILLPLSALLTVADPVPITFVDWLVNIAILLIGIGAWWVFRD